MTVQVSRRGGAQTQPLQATLHGHPVTVTTQRMHRNHQGKLVRVADVVDAKGRQVTVRLRHLRIVRPPAKVRRVGPRRK